MTKNGQLGAYIGTTCDELPSYESGEMFETFGRLAEKFSRDETFGSLARRFEFPAQPHTFTINREFEVSQKEIAEETERVLRRMLDIE